MKVIVVGGGAAGMMAAIWAARNNNEVIMRSLERSCLLQVKADVILQMRVILRTCFQTW